MIDRPARARIDEVGIPTAGDFDAPPVATTGRDGPIAHCDICDQFIPFAVGKRVGNADDGGERAARDDIAAEINHRGLELSDGECSGAGAVYNVALRKRVQHERGGGKMGRGARSGVEAPMWLAHGNDGGSEFAGRGHALFPGSIFPKTAGDFGGGVECAPRAVAPRVKEREHREQFRRDARRFALGAEPAAEFTRFIVATEDLSKAVDLRECGGLGGGGSGGVADGKAQLERRAEHRLVMGDVPSRGSGTAHESENGESRNREVTQGCGEGFHGA